MIKTCNKCKEEKPLDKFTRNKNKKDGMHSICKQCRKEYRESAKEQISQYRKNNREKIAKQDYEYYRNNKDRIHERKRNRYKNDIPYRIRMNLSNGLRSALNKIGRIKKISVLKYIGCNLETLQHHLNSTKNSDCGDDLHIDHIIPCSLFDHNNEKEIKKCWNWRNLRYLPKKENLSKADILDMDLVKQYGIEHLLPENNGEKR